MELQNLVNQLKKAIASNKLISELQQNPSLALPIRLALKMSQKEFVKTTGISQVTLIKYEKNKTQRITLKNANRIANIFYKQQPIIDNSEILEKYRLFKDMQSGKLMTSERAKKLQKIWQRFTTKKQRSEWGRMGAYLTNKKQRLTKQENKINLLLQRYNLNFKCHHEISTKSLKLNIDFVIFRNEDPIAFIESSERKSNLYNYALAYCYKASLLKQKYPNAKLIFISSNLTQSAKQILNNEFHFILKDSEVPKVFHLLR